MKSILTKLAMISIALLFIYLTPTNTKAQFTIEWEKNYGGSLRDYVNDCQQTIDGGYIVVGRSESNDGDIDGSNGDFDCWIIKLDELGSLEWEKNYGGSDDDSAESVQQTMDGGYIVAGETWSNDGDVGGNNGIVDFWIIKLDQLGNLQWEKNYGGLGAEGAESVQQTTDGGYIVAGSATSANGDVGGNNGNYDHWIIKLDQLGNLQWEKNYGGSGYEGRSSIQQTTDGGYIVAGSSTSDDGDVGGNNGANDYWIIKLDGSGNLQWEKNYGGPFVDLAQSIQQTTDGGYISVGYSYSTDGDVGGNNGGYDYWIIKLDGSGNLQWEKNYGGLEEDQAYSVLQTTDGGYIVAGYSESNDGDVGENNGDYDSWIIKLDELGSLDWEKNLGGSGWDRAYSIQQTPDGWYVVAGWSTSSDGDVSGNNGRLDYWIVKFGICYPDLSNCHIDDWEALKAIYESTNGDSWTNRTGWETYIAPTICPPEDCNLGNLYGVTLDGSGRVVELNLTSNGLNGTLPTEIVSLSNLKKLILEDNLLNGVIPWTIANISGLEELNLASNDFSSNGLNIGNLNSLIHLDLSNNLIESTIPIVLSGLINLTYLNLSNNLYYGSIPTELASLGNTLSFFNVSNNNLTGCYPEDLISFCDSFTNADISDGNSFNATWDSFCNGDANAVCDKCNIDDWTALKALYESTDGDNWTNNSGWNVMIDDLSTPPANCDLELLYGVSLSDEGRVKIIDLGNAFSEMPGNNLTGQIPPEICKLTELTELLLSNNNLSGNIPPQVGNLNKLRWLELNSNELSGEIPATFANLDFRIITMYFGFNDLTGCYPFPQDFSFCFEQHYDNHLGNNFEYTILQFCNEGLGACNNGTVPPAPCNFPIQPDPIAPEWPPLKALYESTDGDNWTNRSGWDVFIDSQTSPPSNYDLGNLHGITTSTNPLNRGSNDVVSSIILNNNNLTGTIPADLESLSNLTVLRLNDNNLTGSIPPELGNLNNLTYLWINGNQLNGNIPSELGNLNNLRFLRLYTNQFSGSIPPQLGNLNNLEYLELGNNQLSGTIPPQLGSLSNLILFQLSFNQLSGAIPPQLGNLSNLEFLYLTSNLLSGSIPPELSNLGNLDLLDINDNNLSGCYNDDLQIFCTQLTSSFFDGNEDVSDGNNFNASWEDFCATNAGACSSSCIDDLIIDSNTPFQNLYQSANTITTQGTVTILTNQQVEYNSNRITLNQNFKARAGAGFKVRNDGCY